MTLFQTIKLALSNIKGNKMRSFLTMLGMIIGVASVIILVSLMEGMTNGILSSYKEMGINNITVSITGRNGNPILTEKDMYQYVEHHSEHLLGVVPTISFQGNLKKDTNKLESIQLTGIDEKYLDLNKKVLDSGRPIVYSDILSRQKVGIIGSYINQKLFFGNAKIDDAFFINGEQYKVIGILKEQSDSSEWSKDNCLYLPYTTLARQANIGSITNYTFYGKNSTSVIAETNNLQNYLYSIFHNSKLYSVTNMVDMLNQVKSQQNMMTSALGGIAGISLLVAGIGIMNIMLVSVSERTREIGIRKSLGARKKDIMRQFIMEAGITSSLGGFIGILLGLFGSEKIGTLLKIKSTSSSTAILISFGISVGIGVLFGYLPANKAAKLNPIDALRSD